MPFEKIHQLICNEPMLRNADNSYVSLEWVQERSFIIDGKEIDGFILYDLKDSNSIYIQMVYVDKKTRYWQKINS